MIFNKTVNNTNWIATNGKVRLKSKSPPGPLTSELEISIERLIIQNLYAIL